MYAYVAFVDGGKAVVSIKLIKKFSPKNTSDFNPDVLKNVYWKSSADDEGYYKASVQLLSGKFFFVSLHYSCRLKICNLSA